MSGALPGRRRRRRDLLLVEGDGSEALGFLQDNGGGGAQAALTCGQPQRRSVASCPRAYSPPLTSALTWLRLLQLLAVFPPDRGRGGHPVELRVPVLLVHHWKNEMLAGGELVRFWLAAAEAITHLSRPAR